MRHRDLHDSQNRRRNDGGGSTDPSTEDRDFTRYQASKDPGLQAELVERYRWLALHCARRFSSRGESKDDLAQVAMLGLVVAIERFDPTVGVRFSTFAVPTILGELRRHFRDRTWAVKVTRRVKDLYLETSAAVEQMSQALGRPPRPEEVAEQLGVTVEAVLEAMEAGAAYRPVSLTVESDDDGDGDVIAGAALGGPDMQLERSDSRLEIRRLLRELPARERKIVYLRFYRELTQSEIADKVGVSQVHVSRILRSTLSELRAGLMPAEAADAVPSSPELREYATGSAG